MTLTKLDALAEIFARISGRTRDDVIIEMKSTVLKNISDPSGLYAEISQEEFDRFIEIGENEQAGILNWMLSGAKSGGNPFPEN